MAQSNQRVSENSETQQTLTNTFIPKDPNNLGSAGLFDVLQQLQKHEDKLRAQVFQHLLTQVQNTDNKDNVTVISEASNLLINRSEKLNSKKFKIEENGIDNSLGEQLKNYVETIQQINQCEGDLETLQILQKLNSEKNRTIRLINENQFDQAAEEIMALKQALKRNGDTSNALLIKTYKECKKQLSNKIDLILKQCIVIDSTGIICSQNLQETAILAWKGLIRMNKYQITTGKFAYGLEQKFLIPIFERKISGIQEQLEDQNQICLKFVSQEETTQSFGQIVTILLQFLKKHAFFELEDVMKSFGACFWKYFSDVYVNNLSDQLVSLDFDQSWQLLSKNLDGGSELESAIQNLGFLDQEHSETLSNGLKELEQQLSRQCRITFASEARELIFNKYNSTIFAGKKLPINIDFYKQLIKRWVGEETDPPCGWQRGESLTAKGFFGVSEGIVKLVERIQIVLLESSLNDNQSRKNSLVDAVHDAFDMVRCIPPSIYPQLNQIPSMALLHHNNCNYLADYICSIPPTYEKVFSMQQMQRFLGEVLKFRGSADQIRKQVMGETQRQLMDLADELQGFTSLRRVFNSSIASGGLSLRKTVSQIMSLFQRLGNQLRGVCTPGDFVDTVGTMLDTICSRIVMDTIAKKDISIEESEEIPKILEPLTQDILKVIVDDSRNSQFNSKADKDLLELQDIDTEILKYAIKSRAPGYSKLRGLMEILMAKMLDIQKWWEEGKLSQEGFEVDEVVHLIHALFQDTDQRKMRLQQIMGTTPKQVPKTVEFL